MPTPTTPLGPIMVDIDGLELTPADRAVLTHPLTGGVILFSRNYKSKDQLAALVNDIRAVRQPTLIVAVDQEGGRVQRFREGFTQMPPMRFFGKLYEHQEHLALQRAEDCGWVLGCELREMGIDLNFAPVIDLDYGVSEVIGDRAFSGDPVIVSRLASALMAGLHSAGLASCIKHFPGHGFVSADSHHELPLDGREREQYEVDLGPFRQLATKARSVMTAHLVATCEDQELVSFSKRWVTGILREELGFKGVVFSDDLSMKGADCEGGIRAKVARTLQAGCQFLPICNDRKAVLELYAAAPVYAGSARLSTLRAKPAISNSYKNTMRYTNFVEFISRSRGISHDG